MNPYGPAAGSRVPEENKPEQQLRKDPNARVEYQEYKPKEELIHGEEQDTLILILAVHKRSPPLQLLLTLQLRVQLTSAGLLRISGERPQENAPNKPLKFSKEIQVPKDCETNWITAKLVNGVLFVVLPKKVPKSTGGKRTRSLTNGGGGGGDLFDPTPAAGIRRRNLSSTTLRPRNVWGAVKEKLGNWKLAVPVALLLGLLIGMIAGDTFGYFQDKY